MGTAEEAASLAPADALAGLLAARDLVVASELSGDEPWVTDVIAHALSLDAARQTHSGRAEDLDGFWGTILQRYGPLGAQPTDPRAVELYRQARLFLAANALLGSDGSLPARTLRKLRDKGGGTIRGADLRATWPVALGGL